MRHVILATAGHIDHGKTELTKALTGIDTDRLPEEKARGITIDLGFAHLTLGGRQVAVIDVPGHERFVKNMLAGVGGIDLALLVVAADESVMPQTREHLAILELLGVRRGLVALTKSDLVDADLLELVRLEACEFVRGTFLEGAPVLAVSARTGAGLPELRDAIGETLADVAPRDVEGPFRLHVDRAFTVRGFGSVVTGTVVSGRTAVGEELELAPLGRLLKVRGIEVHGEQAGKVEAGSRAALNLSNVELDELERGQQVVSPGLFRPSSRLDVRLRLLDDAKELRQQRRVRFHLGAIEVLARVRLLGVPQGRLDPGETCFAELRLERPLVAWPRDRFILRSYSPMRTIGGGVVVDSLPPRQRRRETERLALLGRLEAAPDLKARLTELLQEAGTHGMPLADAVARTGSWPSRLEAALHGAPGLVRVSGGEGRLYRREAWGELGSRVRKVLGGFHAREPLREGMSREELRARAIGEDVSAARQLLEELAREKMVSLRGDLVALGGHRVELSEDEAGAKSRIESAFRAGGMSPPAVKDVLAALGADAERGERLLPVLVREGRLVAVPGGLYFHGEAVGEIKRRLEAATTPFTVAEFKDLVGTTRKYAVPLLEYLDSIRFTVRHGDRRTVLRRP